MKRKLLLADDSVTIQKVVNLTFADEGIDVITVGDGDAAMAKISEIAPDVVLADVHMPGLSGYQVCEMVRANESTRELPVVLLVGSFEPFDENEAARVGANAFLTKPFQSIRQLVSQVSDLMPAAPPQAAESEAPAPVEATPEEAIYHEAVGEPTAPKIPDTTDIDRLYSQSVGESSDEGEAGLPTYVDAGMDDEMIETVHAGDSQLPEYDQEPTAEYQQPVEYDQQPVAEFQESPAYDSEPAPAYQQPSEFNQQPDSAFRGEPAYSAQPGSAYQPPAEYEQQPVAQFDDRSFEETTPAYPEHERDQQPSAEYPESTYQEEPAQTVSPFDAPAEEAPSVFQSPGISESNSVFDSYAATQPLSDVSEQPTDQFVLNESDLLELPPIDDGISTVLTAEGGKQIVSLSPELMEMLVEKVVKKLSNKE